MQPLRYYFLVLAFACGVVVVGRIGMSDAAKAAPPMAIEAVFQGWHPFAQLDAQLDVLNSKMKPFKGMSKLTVIGKSGEGHRKLRILSLGKPPSKKKRKKNAPVEPRHEFMLMGTMHGREWISAYAVLYLAWQLVEGYVSGDDKVKRLLDQNQVHLFPFLNPDGYEFTRGSKTQTARLWRKNRRALCSADNCAHGIDLNRNWGVKKKTWGFGATRATSDVYQGKRPFSEPELKAIAGWLRSHAKNLDVFFDVHCCSGEVLPPVYYHDEPADLIAENLAMCGRIARSMNMAMDNTTLGRRRKFRYKFREREKEFSETNTGIGVDWIYGEAKVKKVFIIETRGNDTKILDYIFDMDPKLIIPVSKEVQAGFWQAVRETVEALEGEGKEESESAVAPEASSESANEDSEEAEPGDKDQQDPVENPVQLDAILDEMSSEEGAEESADDAARDTDVLENANVAVNDVGGDVASNVEAAKLAGEELGKDSNFVSDFDSMVESSDAEDGANTTVDLAALGDFDESDANMDSADVLDVDLENGMDAEIDEEKPEESSASVDELDEDEADTEAGGEAKAEEAASDLLDAADGLDDAEESQDDLSLDDQLKLEEESSAETRSAQDPLDSDSDEEKESTSETEEETTATTDELQTAEDTEADADSHPLDPPSDDGGPGTDAEADAEIDIGAESDGVGAGDLDSVMADQESDSAGDSNRHDDDDEPFKGLDEALAQSQEESKLEDEADELDTAEADSANDEDGGDRDQRLKRQMRQWKEHQTQFKSRMEEMDKLLGPDEDRKPDIHYSYAVRLGSSNNEIPLWELAAGGTFLLALTVVLRHRYLHNKQQHID